MVTMIHKIHGQISAETVADLQAMIDYQDAKLVKVSNVRTYFAKGTVKQGSAHDTWNKASDSVKASIVRAFIEDNALDHKKVNRYTVPFLNTVKPSYTSYVQWLNAHDGKLPIDDSVLIEHVKEYEALIESWNDSRLANIVRSYNTSRRAMVVNEEVSDSRAIV